MIFFPEPAYDAAGNCIGQMMTPVPQGAYVVESESGHRALIRGCGEVRLVTADGHAHTIIATDCIDLDELWRWADATDIEALIAKCEGLNR